jgi:hypothetical protein
VPKPAPKKEPKPELVYELEGAPPKLFLVWSQGLEMWLAPNGISWTPFIVGAGTFNEARADELAADGSVGSNLTVKPLLDAVREQVDGANPVVLQTIAALGAR